MDGSGPQRDLRWQRCKNCAVIVNPNFTTSITVEIISLTPPSVSAANQTVLKKILLQILILFLLPASVFAQYTGGIGRGEVIAFINTNQLNGEMPPIFGGGVGRGETVFNGNGTPLNGSTPSIYGGGIGRGENTTFINTNPLSGDTIAIYGGGIGRGETQKSIDAKPLDGSTLTIFGGGIGRGEIVFTKNTNALDGTALNIYGGGDGRGEDVVSISTTQLDGTQQISMFLGGPGRGETMQERPAGALPVTLLSFSAALAGDQVLIQWQTSSELNSAYFVVEKSLDGINWQPIGQVPAAGTSSSPLSYQLYDPHPVEGINYYRLKPTDIDGNSTYSGVATVRYHLGTVSGILVYPNPVTFEFTVELKGSAPDTKINVSLVNAQGQVMFQKQDLVGNRQTFNISNLAAGVYYLLINKNGEMTTTKIVKQ